METSSRESSPSPAAPPGAAPAKRSRGGFGALGRILRRSWMVLVLGALLCLPFLIWGEDFLQWFTGDAAIGWIRGWGAWGWLAVIGLLMSDLFLPIPATPVMSAAGYLYGAWLGGLISMAGSFAAGLLGYGLCRWFGRSIALRLAGEDELLAYEGVFRRKGPWLVAVSRWLPLLPEVITCLAGLVRMPAGVFALALACGSAPMGFVYAYIGATGQNHPRLALGLSLLVPPLLWLVLRPWLRGVRNPRKGSAARAA